MAGKPIRLGKAAGELNVGIPTIVEFLDSKGIKIDPSPTSRLEQEHFEILCQEFAADLNLKEQSKASMRREKRESLSLKDKPLEEPKVEAPDADEDEEEINLEEIKRQVLNEPVVKTPAPASTAPENSVNVVGKIDLDALNQRTRPEKKKDDTAAEAAASTNTPEQEDASPSASASAPEIETIRVKIGRAHV